MKKPTLIPVGGCDVPPRKDAEDFMRELEIDVLARTMWGEARGEGDIGLEAVANVVLNRVKVADAHNGKYWWGHSIITVSQKPYQFSCWNRSDPSYQKLKDVDESNIYFKTCLRIARRAVIGKLEDHTNGATHYHADYVSPHWTKGEEPTVIIGHHIFYKLVEI